MGNPPGDQIRRTLDKIYAIEDSSMDEALMLAQLECLVDVEWEPDERQAEDETVDR